jgi:hypothetical protein
VSQQASHPQIRNASALLVLPPALFQSNFQMRLAPFNFTMSNSGHAVSISATNPA